MEWYMIISIDTWALEYRIAIVFVVLLGEAMAHQSPYHLAHFSTGQLTSANIGMEPAQCQVE